MENNMKKLIVPFVISIPLLLALYLSSRAESATIDVPVAVNQSQGLYVYTFDKAITATEVQIVYGGYTATFTTTGTIIDLTGLVITSSVELTLTGHATTLTMIESDNPDEPYIAFSSIEDFKFQFVKFYNKLYLPTVQN